VFEKPSPTALRFFSRRLPPWRRSATHNLYSQGHPVLVFGVENAQHVAAAGWKKLDVQKVLFEMARKPWGLAKNRGKSKGPFFPV
jgi:hypothetical protein